MPIASAPGPERYQRLRRATLGGSLLLTLGLPLWHLRHNLAGSAGLGGGTGWAPLAGKLGSGGSEPLGLGAPWSLRVLGLEFLDPVAGLSLLAGGHLGRAALWGLLPTALLVMALGRFFCGWLCPYLPLLAASNALRALLARFGLRPPDLQLPRWTNRAVLAACLGATAASGTQLIPLFYPPSVIGRAVYHAVFQGGLTASALALLAAFAFDAGLSRAGFCRYLCPGGATFSLLSLRSPVIVQRNPQACIECRKCDVVCNLLQQPMSDKLDAGCERCGKCVASCPTDALALRIARGPR